MLLEMTLTKWLETQSPLWVIYALVITGMVALGRMGLKWLPTVFEKHCQMLDTATESMAKSAGAIAEINSHVAENRSHLRLGQNAIAEAAVPACKAILALTPDDRRTEVKDHLDDVVRILAKPKGNP